MALNAGPPQEGTIIPDLKSIKVAIVDYGLGNLFSVGNACAQVGLSPSVTSSRAELFDADLVILPGVGAFGDAMESLSRLDLVAPLKEIAASGKPLVGICLGMQLLMTESYEFGRHRGLGIIDGPVMGLGDSANPLDISRDEQLRSVKVPQVGWNRISKKWDHESKKGNVELEADPWSESPLAGLADGEFMYFVHSYYVEPQDSSLVMSVTEYGSNEFCSSLRFGNVFACQFHPERSGIQGLNIYRNMIPLLPHETAAGRQNHG